MIKTLLSIILITCYTNSFGQEQKSILAEDFRRIDEMFGDVVFFDINQCNRYNAIFSELNNFKVVKVDSFDLTIKHKDLNTRLTVYRIKTMYTGHSIEVNVPEHNRKKFMTDTLTFFTVSDYHNTYKLFGFYSSDILRLTHNFDKIGLSQFSRELARNNILNRKQANAFKKSILNKKQAYSKKLRMPSQLLKYYFPDNEINRANTILLPYEPFIQNAL